MEPETTMSGHGDEHMTPAPITRDLEQASDDELRRLIKAASAHLAARDAERKRAAVAKIRMLAKEHGLNVAIDPPARKRGRPPKKE